MDSRPTSVQCAFCRVLIGSVVIRNPLALPMVLGPILLMSAPEILDEDEREINVGYHLVSVTEIEH